MVGEADGEALRVGIGDVAVEYGVDVLIGNRDVEDLRTVKYL